MFEQPNEGRPEGVHAKFDSECPWCDGSILAGDPIFLSDDKEWICEECNNEEESEWPS